MKGTEIHIPKLCEIELGTIYCRQENRAVAPSFTQYERSKQVNSFLLYIFVIICVKGFRSSHGLNLRHKINTNDDGP
jgi:hypothetical protein